MSSELAVPTVKNYVSSIKTYFKCNCVNIEVFYSHQLALTHSSLTKNYSPPVSLKPIFSPQQFVQFLNFSNQLPLHKFYKIAFIFGYHALFRISNVASTSFAAFDLLHHLRRGDVSIVGSSIIIHQRWTKTLQKYRQSGFIRLFAIPGSPVCPLALAAFICLQHSHPVLPSDPFLWYRASGRLYIITQNHLWRTLKCLVTALKFSPHPSFHAFRRSGASLAFVSGVPFQAIQAHGT
jgi:integrase